jgi:uncharacterized membrane protein
VVAQVSGCDDNRTRHGRIYKKVIEMNQSATDNPVNLQAAKIIYILYLVGLATGLTLVIGVIMAYINREDPPEWLQSHFRFQIRTFWIGLLYCVIGVILSMVLVGILVLLFAAVWLIIRVVKGFKYLEQRQPVADVETWMF